MMITDYFALFLTLATLITGIIWILDKAYLSKRRKHLFLDKPSKTIELCSSLFPVFLIVFVIRSFIVQPFLVPTGSLEPTIIPHEYIVVNQYAYGIHLPVLNKKVYDVAEPKTGDLALFRWPVNEKVTFVKRVIGTPGDQITYTDNILYVNGKEAKQTYIGPGIDIEPGGNHPAKVFEEDLSGTKHNILLLQDGSEAQDFDITVPEGMYFMMGDNRDMSYDSRGWGFVPEENLIGKPILVLLSWGTEPFSIRWHRMGTRLH